MVSDIDTSFGHETILGAHLLDTGGLPSFVKLVFDSMKLENAMAPLSSETCSGLPSQHLVPNLTGLVYVLTLQDDADEAMYHHE